MGYDLEPRNKSLESFHFGAFAFPCLLKLVGFLFPFQQKTKYTFIQGIDKRFDIDNYPAILSNDGFRVTAEEARIMARCARNFIVIQRNLTKEDIKDEYCPVKKIRVDWTDHFERFARWAEKSRGFRIL